jgi:hypothetical protein
MYAIIAFKERKKKGKKETHARRMMYEVIYLLSNFYCLL